MVTTNLDSVINKLFKVPDSQYGSKYQDHLLEQYKLSVEMADKISERRATANTFFLSLNSFLLTVLGVLPQLKSNIVEFTIVWIVVVVIAGISFCIAWIMIIMGYNKLNEAKFKVINKIEEKLPVAMYATEWDYLKLLSIRYSPLSLIERWVPIIVIRLYASLATDSVLVSLGLLKIPFGSF
jgi:hypothetical protein